jgi:hypothetical protein
MAKFKVIESFEFEGEPVEVGAEIELTPEQVAVFASKLDRVAEEVDAQTAPQDASGSTAAPTAQDASGSTDTPTATDPTSTQVAPGQDASQAA